MKTRVYLSGKITGDPDYAFKFKCAELYVKSLGYKVISPVGRFDKPGMPWIYYMIRALRKMLKCNAIYMLPDWVYSKGAQIEHSLAVNLEYEIIQGEWEDLNEFGYREI